MTPPTTGKGVCRQHHLPKSCICSDVLADSRRRRSPPETRRWSAAASTSACAAAAACSALAAARRAMATSGSTAPPAPPPPLLLSWDPALQRRRAATRQALARQQCASSARWCSGLAWYEREALVSGRYHGDRRFVGSRSSALQFRACMQPSQRESRPTPAAVAAAKASSDTVQQPLVSPCSKL